MQDDLLNSHHTVEETLVFAAKVGGRGRGWGWGWGWGWGLYRASNVCMPCA